MKRSALLFIFLLAVNVFAGKYHPAVQYIFPLPESKGLSDQTTIIIRVYKQYLDQIGSLNDFMEVSGNTNGVYEGNIFLSSDNQTVIFQPESGNFLMNDQITVKVKTSRFTSSDFNYNFHIESRGSNDMSKLSPMQWENHIIEPKKSFTSSNIRIINGVAVPGDFPQIVTTEYGETAPGKIFYSSRFRETIDSYVISVRNDGTPYMYNRFDGSGDTANFVRHPNGTFSVFFFGPRHHAILDDGLNIIDIYPGGHGYEPDEHEFLILENGHALMILEEHIRVDMSKIIAGGNSNATVHGNMFQEYDENKNVVFEWRSWDHFTFDDPIGINMRDRNIDYVHMNAVSLDFDGHYILSSKHLNEITKINSKTGEIIWRWGGYNNEFNFINDELTFSYQHHVRAVPGMPGNYTLFDNGNMRSPNYSRAVEFKLDTLNMTADKVWEYIFEPKRRSYWMGSVQRLDNGNTFIDCSTTSPAMTMEVTPDGEKVFQMLSHGSSSYRSFRYDLDVNAETPFFMLENFGYTLNLLFNKWGDANVAHYKICHKLQEDSQYSLLDTTSNTWYQAKGLENAKYHLFKISAVAEDGTESEFSREITARVYYITPGTNLVRNSTFTSEANWSLEKFNSGDASGSVSSDGYTIEIQEGGNSISDIRLVQNNIHLTQTMKYQLEFDAFSEAARYIKPVLRADSFPFTEYSQFGYQAVDNEKKHYILNFLMEDNSNSNAILSFDCGRFDQNVTFDNVILKTVIESSINESKQHISKTFQLFQNYPNPFNSNTKIKFQISDFNHVNLSVYNTLGQMVALLIDEEKSEGKYTIHFNPVKYGILSQTSGVYLYKLEVGNHVTIRKMLYLK